MARATKAIPEGFHTVTPGLVFQNATEAINFYKRALGAEVKSNMPGPDGRGVMHAELKIGDSMIFVSDEMPQSPAKSPKTLGGNTMVLNVYVPDVDTTFRQATEAGAKTAMPVADQFWGDRYGQFTDPFGYTWGVATHKEDLSANEMNERAKQFFAQMQQQKKSA